MKPASSSLFKCALALVLLGQASLARAEYPVESLRNALNKVPVAEVPATAAELVAKAPLRDRDVVATEVVKLVVKSHPTVSVAAVGLISSKCAAAASVAAAPAAEAQPQQVKLIVKAAASGAPSQAGAIVRAVCKVIPAHTEVALAVAEGAPS